jgi:imidazolonepropionase-like amidohydrolase
MSASLKLSVAAACALLATPVTAQTIAITGGRVYPVSGPVIENGTVLIRDGRIVAVGTGVAIPADAQRIDATGKWVTPGFINAGTQLGLVEIGAVADTRDAMARGDNAVAASFRAWDGLNPNTALFPPARNEGITTVLVSPAGGLISGQAALVDLVNGSVTDMVRRAPAAMVAQMGDPRGANTNARAEQMARLREILSDAREYRRRRADFEANRTRDFATSRLNLEAMAPVLDGTLPLVIAVDRSSDIEAALAIAREFNIRLVIASGSEAWLVADKVAAARVPVLTGGIANIPQNFAALNTRSEGAAMLRRAGVPVAMIGTSYGDEQGFNVRNVKFEAGNAVASGMSWDDALRSVTLTPAEIFGAGDRLGSLSPGKDANIVVWSGDPFEFLTKAEHVIIRGQRITTPSRQDLLMKRYRTLPPDYRAP